MPTDPDSVNPRDPVFVSYRHSDGKPIAAELTWLLRAAGIPVWRDVDDLPPGDTRERLQQAIDDGISGAVIVVTPEIAASPVVREVEAPRLLDLHRSRPAFALGIVNDVHRPDGELDYSAPDRLLGLERSELKGVDQRETTRPGLVEMAKQMLWHRIASLRPEILSESRAIRISIQTRNTPQVYDRTDADLDVRLRPSTHEKLPSRAGLLDLMETAPFLPDAVTRSAAHGLHIEGGAHLSVAVALGAIIPSTRIGPVTVTDGRGDDWRSTTEAQIPDPERLRVLGRFAGHRPLPEDRRADVAAYVDLQTPPSNAAFEKFLRDHDAILTDWVHIAAVHDGLLDVGDAGNLAAEAAARLRELSMSNGNARVHLMFRGPFAVATLIGRLTNTLRITSYEYDESQSLSAPFVGPRYEPVLEIRASTPTGAIQEVVVPDHA
ncbi:TIR domain-containing protein [Microbacterium sp. SLBN-154]|uniref:SAVED domain-containing protein n=1 Tax=Microbacterium sp. SLBN-154 TaxID=2768458 RepID=UPI0011542BA1|nr:SAVED domain-containing protein [Microbacterium sp. SLBN-154]TQK17949.1 TIR domain-containing protein [Microbacterium sp. SLBN-154]